MNKSIIFFSDAHLSVSYPERARYLLDFFASDEFGKCSAVYVLGDLFDFWIGPKHLELIDYQDILSVLRERTKGGQDIYFVCGNRDFLVDNEFARRTGVKILGDNAKIKLGGKKIWLTHGDLLCTLDKGYRSYRRLARSRLIKSAYQSIPQKAKYGIGKGLRGLSTYLVNHKTEVERTITPKAVESVFKKGYDVIICGHIHNSRKEERKDGKQLFVLGAFSEGWHYLMYKDGVFQPRQFIFGR